MAAHPSVEPRARALYDVLAVGGDDNPICPAGLPDAHLEIEKDGAELGAVARLLRAADRALERMLDAGLRVAVDEPAPGTAPPGRAAVLVKTRAVRVSEDGVVVLPVKEARERVDAEVTSLVEDVCGARIWGWRHKTTRRVWASHRANNVGVTGTLHARPTHGA